MRYEVQYPSGRSFSIEGDSFGMARAGDWLVPTISHSEKGDVVLDQRAIVMCDGKRVYSPRDWLDGLDPEMTKWLKEHPDWDTRN